MNLFNEVPFRKELRAQTMITSPFGPREDPFTGKNNDFHKGIDIFAPYETKLVAWDQLVVTPLPEDPVYGESISCEDPFGNVTRLGHVSPYFPGPTKVKEGTVIAVVNDSGQTTGSHFHMEVG